MKDLEQQFKQHGLKVPFPHRVVRAVNMVRKLFRLKPLDVYLLTATVHGGKMIVYAETSCREVPANQLSPEQIQIEVLNNFLSQGITQLAQAQAHALGTVRVTNENGESRDVTVSAPSVKETRH